MKKLEEELQDEIQNGEFDDKIKNYCAWCGVKIPDGVIRYIHLGNSCYECSARVSRIVGGVRSIMKNKQGKNISCKIREYTEDEKTEMLLERIADVQSQKLNKQTYEIT